MTTPAWAGAPEFSVFVNCPFDEGYHAALDAIVYTSVHAGFFPWMAGSTGSVAVPRLQCILEGLQWCRYSIHDVTRYQGEGPDNVSRFNMPLELGMAMGIRGVNPKGDAHDWMVMVPEGHLYRRYISDLAGFDPSTHDGSQEEVAVSVLTWLATRPTVQATVRPDDVIAKLPEYSARKRELDDGWNAKTPWGHVIELAVQIARG